jgi:phasin family protein
MIIETLLALTEPTRNVFEPAQKFKKHAVASVEKLAAYQLESLKRCSDMAVGQLKAAAEIKDSEDLQNFLFKQTDVLRVFGEGALSDITAVAQVGIDLLLPQATNVGTKGVPVAKAA